MWKLRKFTVTLPQCGNYGIFLSPIFAKISWKHFFTNNLCCFQVTVIFFIFPLCDTQWSLLNFCITWKLFRETNHIVNSLLKELFSRKFFQKVGIQKFRKIHSVCELLYQKHSNFGLLAFFGHLCYRITATRLLTFYTDLMADGLTFDLAKSYCKQESN